MLSPTNRLMLMLRLHGEVSQTVLMVPPFYLLVFIFLRPGLIPGIIGTVIMPYRSGEPV